MDKSHRDTILVESAKVLTNDAFTAGQHVIRLQAPEIARRALPGQFIHIQCADDLPMRRPMSIMRANAEKGWVEFLFKVHGRGTARLAEVASGTELSVMGPIGHAFRLDNYKPYAVLIGGGVGIPPMVYLAEHMRAHAVEVFVFMGSEIPFPFKSKPSTIMLNGMPGEVIAAMPLLEDWGIPSRLASQQGYAGCYDGLVTELAKSWITSQTQLAVEEIEIFACGPTPMLKAVAALGKSLGIASQISLEEYMACAVGGCAGCTVLVDTTEGKKMRRVCVDGPVFDGSSVIF